VAEGQVPPDEPAANTLAEFGDSFLTIFRVSHHALDGTSEIKRPRELSIVMVSLPADTKVALRKVFAAFPPGKPIMDELKVPRDRFVSNRSLMR
jgi:hypothetical protein